MVPETRYAKSGNLHIAYQVTGAEPVDLVFVHGWIPHIEHLWEEPSLSRFLSRLASFSRLILLDKRGTGLSDPVEDSARLVAEIQEFLTGVRDQSEPDRVLATVLFADIVGFTDLAAKMGDRRWQDIIQSYYGAVRAECFVEPKSARPGMACSLHSMVQRVQSDAA